MGLGGGSGGLACALPPAAPVGGGGRRGGGPGGEPLGGGGGGGKASSVTIADDTPVAAWCIPGDQESLNAKYAKPKSVPFRGALLGLGGRGAAWPQRLRSRTEPQRGRPAAPQGRRVPQWRRLLRALGPGRRRFGAVSHAPAHGRRFPGHARDRGAWRQLGARGIVPA